MSMRDDMVLFHLFLCGKLLNYQVKDLNILTSIIRNNFPKMVSFKEKLGYFIFTAVPVCLWIKYIHYYFETKKIMEDMTREHKKHNCVVTYCKDTGMEGWPENSGRLKLTLNNVLKFKEPIIYFIDTTERRLDICVMILYCPDIINALQNSLQRGIQLRLILDPRYDNNSAQMQQLIKEGAEIMYDAKEVNVESMMHNKYAIKDFDKETHCGYTVCGSMNWTQTAFTDNYEYLVFSSNRQAVGAFNKNFEETWEYLKKLKESNQQNDALYQL